MHRREHVILYMLDGQLSERMPSMQDRLDALEHHPLLSPLGNVLQHWKTDPFVQQLKQNDLAWYVKAKAAVRGLDAQHAGDGSFVEALLSEQMVVVQQVGEDIYNKLTFNVAGDDDGELAHVKKTEWRWLSPASLALFRTLLLACGFKMTADESKLTAASGDAVVRFLSHASSIYCHNWLRKMR